MVINNSIKKLMDDFFGKIGKDELIMLNSVPPEAAFNYVYFLYKKLYGDYPTGDVYKILEGKFAQRAAA